MFRKIFSILTASVLALFATSVFSQQQIPKAQAKQWDKQTKADAKAAKKRGKTPDGRPVLIDETGKSYLLTDDGKRFLVDQKGRKVQVDRMGKVILLPEQKEVNMNRLGPGPIA